MVKLGWADPFTQAVGAGTEAPPLLRWNVIPEPGQAQRRCPYSAGMSFLSRPLDIPHELC